MGEQHSDFEKDDPAHNEPLEEKDFIQENPLSGKLSVWSFVFLLILLIMTFFGAYSWLLQDLNQEKLTKPLLEVSNRQFSLFLWQFPSFFRLHAPSKTGYLPAFETNGERVILPEANDEVTAPPDLLFLYQTWERLLAHNYYKRPIDPELFKEFLEQTQLWLPQIWQEAPQEYVKIIETKAYLAHPNLQILTYQELPLIVRRAFQGWQNYFLEGNAINSMQLTLAEVKDFLISNPHYSRNYWRNIDVINKQQVAGLKYLKILDDQTVSLDTFIPNEELSSFLRVGFYNMRQFEKKL